MRALLGSKSRAVAITGTGGGFASTGAGLGCSTFAITNCAALSGGFSTGRTRSTGRTGTRTAFTSATLFRLPAARPGRRRSVPASAG